MADNARFHNKLHRRNHHSIQSPGYPDSGTDPIASTDEPFQGDMVVNATVSAQNLHINTDAFIGNNTTIMGNLCVYGADSYFETYTTVTSSMSVINHGDGPALTVKQTGPEPIARFLDGDAVGSENALLIADTGQIVINADRPVLDRRVTISGSITASGNTEFQGGSATSSRTFAANLGAANNWDAAAFNTGNADGMRSFAINTNTLATGSGSFAHGFSTKATGLYSHSEGNSSIALGTTSHAEGDSCEAQGEGSHAEGSSTIAQGDYCHAEGENSQAGDGTNAAHSEGHHTYAAGDFSHAEGYYTRATGSRAHAEGENTRAAGFAAHTEGFRTSAFADNSHAEGQNTAARGVGSHSEGLSSVAIGNFSHTEGTSTSAVGVYSHAEGEITAALGTTTHTEGFKTSAVNAYAHAEGYTTLAYGSASHTEGWLTAASGTGSHAEGFFTTASGQFAHAEGERTFAFGRSSHTEGLSTFTISDYGHAEGVYTIAGSGAHAEGGYTAALGYTSHSEGFVTSATGLASHAQGAYTIAQGIASFAGGTNSVAIGNYSSTYGNYNSAVGESSHASGFLTLARGGASYTYGIQTSALELAAVAGGAFSVAAAPASHAMGYFNIATETASGAFVTGSTNLVAGKASVALGLQAQARHDVSFVFGGDENRTVPISSTRTGQFLVSAQGGVYIPGTVGIGHNSILNEAQWISGVDPLLSNILNIRDGNVRVQGVDMSTQDLSALTAANTDGQSLFDLRSQDIGANYSLSIAESGFGFPGPAHFLKFFGGRTGDPQAFINVKEGDPLRFGSFSNFYGQQFKEYMRVGANGNIGIGINHPYASGQYNIEPVAKLTVNGSISSNNTSDARQILSAGTDLWSLGLGGGGGGGGSLTSDITTDLAVGALTALSILRNGATLQHCMERLLTQVSFPTISPFASGSMTAIINAGTVTSGSQREVGEQTTSFTAALNPGAWIGNLVGGVWNPSTFQINAAGAANNYLFFGNVDNLTNTLLTTAANINDGTNSYAINIGFNAGAQPINSKSVLQPAFGPGRAPGAMTIIGRRKLFYSNDTSASAPADSSAVRGLTGVIGSGSTWPANGTSFNIPVWAGTKRIVIAYPTTFGTISEVRNGLGFEVTGDFTQTTVSVNGANSLFPTNYYVYTFIAVGSFVSDETYSVIV